MMTKLTKEQVLNLAEGLKNVSELKGVKFAYAVARNVAALEPIVKSLEKASQPGSQFIEYDNKRTELASSYAEKDEDGKPRVSKGDNGVEQYVIKNRQEFEKEFEALRKRYKAALNERAAQHEEFLKLLGEEVDVELHGISEGDIPKDITTGQLSAIYPIIMGDQS